MKARKLNDNGFSLIELLVAILVCTVVMGAITSLMIFSSSSMNKTNSRINVQTSAKDALNHMEAYVMEAEGVYYDSTHHAMIVFTNKDDYENIESHTLSLDKIATFTHNVYVYWLSGGDLCFGKLAFPSAGLSTMELQKENGMLVDIMNLPANHSYYLLGEDCKKFECQINTNHVTDKKSVYLKVGFKDKIAPEYDSERTIFLRNQ